MRHLPKLLCLVALAGVLALLVTAGLADAAVQLALLVGVGGAAAVRVAATVRARPALVTRAVRRRR